MGAMHIENVEARTAPPAPPAPPAARAARTSARAPPPRLFSSISRSALTSPSPWTSPWTEPRQHRVVRDWGAGRGEGEGRVDGSGGAECEERQEQATKATRRPALPAHVARTMQDGSGYLWNGQVYFKPPGGVVGVIHRDLWVSLEDGFSLDDPDSLPDFWDEAQNSEEARGKEIATLREDGNLVAAASSAESCVKAHAGACTHLRWCFCERCVNPRVESAGHYVRDATRHP